MTNSVLLVRSVGMRSMVAQRWARVALLCGSFYNWAHVATSAAAIQTDQPQRNAQYAYLCATSLRGITARIMGQAAPRHVCATRSVKFPGLAGRPPARDQRCAERPARSR